MPIAKPNYTQIPNVLLDDMLPTMPVAELKVTLAIARKTFGYHREKATLSLTTLQELTGLSRQGVINGVNAGVKRKTICRVAAGNSGHVYELIVGADPDAGSQLSRLPDESTDSEVVNLVDPSGQLSRPPVVNEVDQLPPTLKKGIKETIKKEREEEETHAGDPLTVAWRQVYAETELPRKLATSLAALVIECGMAAAIHGIKASAKKEDGRNFRYIAECARNYVPPPPKASYAAGSVYSKATTESTIYDTPAQPPLPEPPLTGLAAIWEISRVEMADVLNGTSGWLDGSELEATDETRKGLPVYRLIVTDASHAEWLRQQADVAIRRSLSVSLHTPIALDIVAEAAP